MRPGTLSYRNWLGVTLGRDTARVQRAATVRRMQDIAGAPAYEILAGGWAMRGMKALDFHTDIYPSLRMDAQAEARVRALVGAAMGRYDESPRNLSFWAVAPALAGVLAGEWLRARMSAARFRRWLLVALAGVGAKLALFG